MTQTAVESSLLARATRMRDLVREHAPESERLRTLSPTIVEQMWDTGVMVAINPAEAGGLETPLPHMIETWIEMAWQDGSFGWTGIANLPAAFAAAYYLPDVGFDEIFTANRGRVAMAGQFAPNGQGAAVDDGYRLTGSWNFGSGTAHSDYIAAGFIPTDDGEPRWAGADLPQLLVAYIPRDEVVFTDGWHVQGLKGTGSYDYNVTDVFVPAHRTIDLFARDPLRGSAPAGRMGLMSVTAAGHAAWALGVAKSMLDDLQDLAATKYRMSDMASLASRPTFQRNLAHHVSAWRAARLLILDLFAQSEAAVAAGSALTPMMRADVRAAAVYATDVARECAQWAHLAAGTTSIREGSRLERAFRDVYTGTQHAFIAEKVAIDASQIWLGLVEDNPAL